MKRIIFHSALFFVFAAQLLAQTGMIKGKVVDAKTKESLPSVNILVKGTYYGASSDFDGNFLIQRINPGVYNIDVTLLGYKTVQYSGIKIEADKTFELNVKMEESVLSLGQEVVIIGEKRLFDVEETSSKNTIRSEDLKVAAVQNVQDVVGLQTGVVQSDNEIHIRGSRGYENAYLVDGVPVQDVLGGTGFGLQISPDAIKEVEVITGGYNAEFGQATSGVVNITLKEGSDNYHGGVSYKSDRFFGTNNRHFFNTDIADFTLSGPLPLFDLFVPGSISFFVSGSGNITDGYTRWSQVIDRKGKPTGAYEVHRPKQLYSSIFNGSDFAFRLANSYSWAAKVTWKPSATEKLSYSYNQSVSVDQNTATIKTTLEREEPTPGYQYEFQNILDSANTFTQINIQHSLAWTQTLDAKSFYEVKLSRYSAHVRGDANGEDYTHYNEPRDIVNYPIQYFQKDSVSTGVVPGDGFYDVGGPFNWRDHFIDDYSVKFDFTNNFTEKNKFKTGVESHFQYFQMIDISNPWIKPLGLNNDIYEVHSASGALYAQDNIIISGMVLNFGLRFDYWFPGKFVDDAVNNPNIPLPSEDIRQKYLNQTNSLFGYRWKGRLSPRLGISHPISDNQTLFFSYGHFSKLPRPTYVYSKLTESSARSSSQTIGNPNLNPETTVAYELGLRNQITEDDVVTVTAYYKDIFDYITARSVKSTNIRFGSSYTTYVNSDYARTRGIEVEYNKRFNKNLRSSLSGSYSIATGKSSSATDAVYNLNTSGAEATIKENFVSWDRPVQLSLTTILNVPKDEPLYDFAPGVLDDYNVFLRMFFQSGKRYTEQIYNGTDLEGRPQYISNSNNPYQLLGAYWFYVNMNIEKFFDLGFAKMTISLEIQNLLDNQNSQIVNPVTGKAYAYGDATPSSYNDPLYPDLQGRISPFPYNPARYLAPRNARLGISFRF